MREATRLARGPSALRLSVELTGRDVIGAGRESMADRRPELERIFDEEENEGHNSHQHKAAVWELASHGAIVGRMASLLGSDLSIWRTNFFVKDGIDSGTPSQYEIPFHQ